MDDLIDVIEGNRRYTRCLYVYNKIDVCSIEEVCAWSLQSLPHSASVHWHSRINMRLSLQMHCFCTAHANWVTNALERAINK